MNVRRSAISALVKIVKAAKAAMQTLKNAKNDQKVEVSLPADFDLVEIQSALKAAVPALSKTLKDSKNGPIRRTSARLIRIPGQAFRTTTILACRAVGRRHRVRMGWVTTRSSTTACFTTIQM